MSHRLGSVSSVCSAAFDPNDIPISVDLVETARFLLDFLCEISTRPELCDGPLVECAIQRYEKYWLPLMAKHSGRLLPAPLDIEWVWHCHMLCPEAYNTYCNNMLGKMIDHHLINRTQRKELMTDSERLWKSEYADVPFSACDAYVSRFDRDFVSALTYNLAQAVSKQKVFFYQVSLPHYQDEKFLNIALMRYKKFLFLKCQNPGVFLVPCYDSDLLWHTHMLHPSFYKSDTETYLGYILPHDDSINDRSSGSKLSLAEAKTRNLWRKVFNEKFSHFGAMYRGEPPNSTFFPMSKEDVSKICTKQADVLIEKIRISGLPVGKTYKLKLSYNTGYQNFNRCLFVTENIATVKGNSRNFEDSIVDAHFQFDTRYNDKLIASLQQKSGKLCIGTSDIVGEGKIDLQKKIQPLNNKGLSANDDIDCGDGLSIGLVWSCAAPTLGPCMLRLEPGAYQSCVMPDDRESLWGPVPLPRLPPGMQSMCSVALHKLFNHTRRVVFTVRVVHSEPLLMSAIHVYYGDKLMALAHLIVGDQLPLPISVSDTKKCVTLNPKEGQRAVLIKNNKGDWGIAVGWWDGFQRRLQGRKGSCSEGHLEVKFFHLHNNRWHFVSFERLYSLATSKFEIGDCVVEFDIGFFEINSQSAEIAENLALIFSVALIHVLCQPRPLNWAPKLTWSKSDGGALPKLGGSEEIALLLAAGVLISTPCNHAIRNLFKNKKQVFGEGGSLNRDSQREGDEQYEHGDSQAMVLHEAEVSSGWSEEWKANNSCGNVEALESPSSSGGPLTVIKEQECDEGLEERAEEEEEEVEEVMTRVMNKTAMMFRVDDSKKDVKEVREALQNPGSQDGGATEDVVPREAEEVVEENEEESDQQSEGVFEVEEYNADADSQVDVFGDGEDDSDEVELDEVDGNGLGHISTGDDSVFAFSHSHESNSALKGLPSPLESNGGFENDIDSYYDEFYNMSGDETVNGFDRSEHSMANHTMANHTDRAGRNVEDSFDSDTGGLPKDVNYAGCGRFGSSKHADTGSSGSSSAGHGKDGRLSGGGSSSQYAMGLLGGSGDGEVVVNDKGRGCVNGSDAESGGDEGGRVNGDNSRR